MAVTFQLPSDLEDELRGQLRDLHAVAKEALLVSLYRQGKLSHPALAKALGLDRVGTEDVLRKHGVNDHPVSAPARIRRTPGVVGGDARVRDTRIPVWTLVELRKQAGPTSSSWRTSPASRRTIYTPRGITTAVTPPKSTKPSRRRRKASPETASASRAPEVRPICHVACRSYTRTFRSPSQEPNRPASMSRRVAPQRQL